MTDQTVQQIHEVTGRVSALEAVSQTLVDGQNRLEHQQRKSADDLRSDIQNLARMIQDRDSKIAEQARPNYGVVIAIAAVIVSMAGLYFDGYRRDLDRIDKNGSRLEAIIREHTSDGHPARVEAKVHAEADRVDDLRDSLTDLSRRLAEHEISVGHPAMQERVYGLAEQIKIIISDLDGGK